jgi:glycosyltransferase involved in cell wall biosynthesis
MADRQIVFCRRAHEIASEVAKQSLAIPCLLYLSAPAYLPSGLSRSLPDFAKSKTVMLLPPSISYHAEDYCNYLIDDASWLAPLDLGLQLLGSAGDPACLRLGEALAFFTTRASNLRWASAEIQNACAQSVSDVPARSNIGFQTSKPSVLAVVPHYGCEEWLFACLHSLVTQSSQPDGIVVVDDSSPIPPTWIVEEFPQVSLLRSTVNVGPERLLNRIISRTVYDAYLVQDADDWSAFDRLERLLTCSRRSGAGLVGSFALNWHIDTSATILQTFPLDVGAAMQRRLGHYLLHGTSLIWRSLAIRLGGFDDRLDLAADSDFLYRAWMAMPVLNIPACSYYRRIRPGSRTTNPETSLSAANRLNEWQEFRHRADLNRVAYAQGRGPKLKVPQGNRKFALKRVIGPKLQTVAT